MRYTKTIMFSMHYKDTTKLDNSKKNEKILGQTEKSPVRTPRFAHARPKGFLPPSIPLLCFQFSLRVYAFAFLFPLFLSRRLYSYYPFFCIFLSLNITLFLLMGMVMDFPPKETNERQFLLPELVSGCKLFENFMFSI